MTFYQRINLLGGEPADFGDDDAGRSQVGFNVIATKEYSLTFLDELVQILEDDGVGTFGTNIFASTQAQIPNGDGPYLSLVQTSGLGPIGNHNKSLKPALVRPSAQVVARAGDFTAANALAYAAYEALLKVRNTDVIP